MILFLDMDGVLNDCWFDDKAKSMRIDPDCVHNFNKIVSEVDFEIVLISAWRYMVLHRSMNIVGFEYMLRTHGLHVCGKLIDCLGEDAESRGQQIRDWLKENKKDEYLILDDMNLDYEGMNFYQTNNGLTEKDARKVINLCLGN